MAFIHQLNQPPQPAWDFLRQVADQYGLAQYTQQPPSYTHASQEGSQAREPSQQQRASDGTEQRATAPEQHEPETGHGCPGGRGRRGGHPGRRGRGYHCGSHGCGRPEQRANPQGNRGYPSWGAHHPFSMPGRTQPGDPSTSGPFDFMSFLENINSHLGVNLQDIMKNMGATPETYNHDEVDFVPRADIFDAPTEYVVHVSLPGAEKKDISVDYDAANSTLRLAGVVFRPEIDESLGNWLVVSDRDREVGVFEKQVRLGTRNAPASVDTEKINAKMVTGVLVVKLPKLAQQEEAARKVPVTHVEKDTKGKDKASEEMDVESHTESGDGDGVHASRSPRVNDEDEEMDYITVDVD